MLDLYDYSLPAIFVVGVVIILAASKVGCRSAYAPASR
jgi:hypothetical protein